jgi:Uncharacterized conserved protein (COG2071)
VLLRIEARDLLIASWPVTEDDVARTLAAGLEPADIDGRYLVSLVAFRAANIRLGRLGAPAFRQLNVRTYVRWKDERAVFFIAARVSLAGLGGILLGAPYRPARLRISNGLLEAPGLGVSLPYRAEEPTDPGAVAAHDIGLFEAAGLRCFRVRRGEAGWRRAVATGPTRADVLLAHGFGPAAGPELLYANQAQFEADVPARRARAGSARTGIR